MDYLRLDSFNELFYKGKLLTKKIDTLSSIFVFDDLPLIIVSYDSGNNRFITIPPNKTNYHVIYPALINNNIQIETWNNKSE